MSEKNTGRVTIPTNLDVVPETIELMKRWGADAIRDCDGTEFPEELTKTGAKIYATYYTTRKDNAWAKANPDEVQQSYIMTNFYTATGNELQIPLMKGISDELMQSIQEMTENAGGKSSTAPQGKWYPQINGNTMRRPAVSASTIQNRSMNIQSAF